MMTARGQEFPEKMPKPEVAPSQQPSPELPAKEPAPEINPPRYPAVEPAKSPEIQPPGTKG